MALTVKYLHPSKLWQFEHGEAYVRLTEQMVVSQGLKNPWGSDQITQGSRESSSKYPNQDEWLPQVYLLKENIVVQEEAPVKRKYFFSVHELYVKLNYGIMNPLSQLL